jgi:hypothetical protein
MTLEKRIDAVLTVAKAGALRPPHGRRRSPRKKPMKPQSVKRRWREYDANVREAARNAAAASRPLDWPEGYPEPPRGFGWVAPDYCKYPDGYCDYPCERCKGGGKRRKAKSWSAADQKAYVRQQTAQAEALSKDPSRCWRCGEKKSDCRCEVIGNYAGYGGKRRHAVTTKVGPRGGVTEVQSYLFPRTLWTEARAKAWAKRNGKLYGDVDVTDKFIRLRQADPDSFKLMRTKCLMRRKGQCVIKAVIGVR